MVEILRLCMKRGPPPLPLLPLSLLSPKLVVVSKAALIASKLSSSSDHFFRPAAAIASGMRRHGARVMPSFNNAARQPPPCPIALHPRLVLATRQPCCLNSIIGKRKTSRTRLETRQPCAPFGTGHEATLSFLSQDHRDNAKQNKIKQSNKNKNNCNININIKAALHPRSALVMRQPCRSFRIIGKTKKRQQQK